MKSVCSGMKTWTLKGKREGGSKGEKGNGVSSGMNTKEEGEFQGKGGTIIPWCGWVS